MPVISILALLGLIIGLVLERKNLLTTTRIRTLSQILVQMIYPCLIFSALLLRFSVSEIQTLWLLPVLIFLVLGIGLIVGRLTLKLTGLEAEATQRSYAFLTIMPNYSFVPLVIAATFFGDRAVGYVALASIGADVFLWTLAYPVIAGRFAWRKIFSPAFVSVLVAGMVLYWVPDRSETWPPFLHGLNGLGQLTLPLSMIVLGYQLGRAPLALKSLDRKAHGYIFAWRLLLCPLLVFAILLLMDLSPLAKSILLLMASMPGAIVSVVLSELHEADSSFAASSILWGHVLAIITVPLWQLGARFAF